MITVFHTSSRSNDKFIEFRDNWILENPNILVYPEFQDYNKPYSDLLKQMENGDVVIFITNPLTHKTNARLIHGLGNFERILQRMQFKYINHAAILRNENKEKKLKFKSTVNSLNLIEFFEDNINDFETLSNYYTSLNPFHKKYEEFNTANVFSKKRHFNIVFARQLFCYMLRENHITYNEIAFLFEMESHASAMNNVDRIAEYIEIYAKRIEIELITKLQIKLREEICK